VRRPFLYMGFWLGAAGGLAAWGLVSLCYWYLKAPVTSLVQGLNGNFQFIALDVTGVALLVVGAVMVSILGAMLAVGRHLRRIEPH